MNSYLHVNGFLPSLLLTMAFLGLLFYVRRTIWGLAIAAFPATLAHELLHYGVGLIVRAQPVGFSLWPKRDGDRWRLGEVAFSRAGIFNSAFIAFAPLLLLPLAWLCLMNVVLPVWISGHWGGWLAAGYLTATLVYGSIPSMTDIRLGLMSLITYLTLCALGWWIFSLIAR